MNAIARYEDFQNFMEWLGREQYSGKPIPILLIKPYLLLDLAERHKHIDSFFSSFHSLTGKDIVFFLPGYVHCPSYKLSSEVFPSNIHWHKEPAFSFYDRYTKQTQKVYYSEDAFTDFFIELRNLTQEFEYLGGAMLLLPTYSFSCNSELGNLDFSNFLQYQYNYNLSELYYHNFVNCNLAFSKVETFLTELYLKLRDYYDNPVDLSSFYKSVRNSYLNCYSQI